MDAEAFAIVDGARQTRNLDLAPVAGARVDLPDRDCSPQESPGLGLHLARDLDDVRLAGRERLRDDPDLEDLEEEEHVSAAESRDAAREAWSGCR